MKQTWKQKRIVRRLQKKAEWQRSFDFAYEQVQPHLRKDMRDGFIFIDAFSCPAHIERAFRALLRQGLRKGYIQTEGWHSDL